MKKRDTKTDTHKGRSPCEDGDRDWSYTTTQVKEDQGLPATTKKLGMTEELQKIRVD